MKQGNRRSTIKEVREMLKLRKNGMSYMKIAKRLGRDHTSVIYWIKKLESPKVSTHKSVSDRINDGKVVICSHPIKNPLIKKVRKTKKIIDKRSICRVCRESKTDPKWLKTNFCSLECFGKSYVRRRTRTEREFD